MQHNQIIAFQETWYSKQNLSIINSLHSDFDGVGVAKIDECDNIVQGTVVVLLSCGTKNWVDVLRNLN